MIFKILILEFSKIDTANKYSHLMQKLLLCTVCFMDQCHWNRAALVNLSSILRKGHVFPVEPLKPSSWAVEEVGP